MIDLHYFGNDDIIVWDLYLATFFLDRKKINWSGDPISIQDHTSGVTSVFWKIIDIEDPKVKGDKMWVSNDNKTGRRLIIVNGVPG